MLPKGVAMECDEVATALDDTKHHSFSLVEEFLHKSIVSVFSSMQIVNEVLSHPLFRFSGGREGYKGECKVLDRNHIVCFYIYYKMSND